MPEDYFGEGVAERSVEAERRRRSAARALSPAETRPQFGAEAAEILGLDLSIESHDKDVANDSSAPHAELDSFDASVRSLEEELNACRVATPPQGPRR